MDLGIPIPVRIASTDELIFVGNVLRDGHALGISVATDERVWDVGQAQEQAFQEAGWREVEEIAP